MSRLIAAAKAPGNASVGAAARTGLALLAPSPAKDSSAAKDAAAIARNLQSQIRVQGRTAYIAACPTCAGAASLEDQAFALALLTKTTPKSGPQATFVQKLSGGVARGPAQAGLGPLCISMGGQAGATASVALAAYDESRGSTTPNVKVTVEVAGSSPAEGKVLLDAEFSKASGVRVASSSTSWGELPANASSLSFEATGKGEVSVAAGLKFTPATLLAFPTYRGLWVERVVQDEAGQGNLAAVSQGQIVTITVQVTTPDDLGQVIVEVLMPGGLEPIDPAVYKDSAAALRCNLGDSGDGGGGCYGRCYSRWYWCPQTQVSPAVVTVRYSSLPAGTAAVSFKATAATMGTYTLPPVKAWAVAQPELMGLSAAGSFVVCPAAQPASATPLVTDPGFGKDDDEVVGTAPVGVDTSTFGPAPAVCGSPASASKPPLAPAKGCPKDCSSNGVCNLASGACLCNQGFTGADCSKPATS